MLKTSKKETKDIIVGMILGDGYLCKRGNSVHYSMCHSGKQEEYLTWKTNLLSDVTKMRVHKYSPIGTYCDDRIMITSTSRAHPWYRDIYNRIYINNNKRITKDILNYITPQSFAIMWMDDGNLFHHFKKCTKKDRCNHDRIGKYRSAGWDATLCTDCYPIEDQLILAKHLKNILGVNFKVSKTRDKYRLRTNGTEFDKLSPQISKYIIPSMKYKIDKNSDWHAKGHDDIVRSCVRAQESSRNV